jgi:hypothetical protein
MLEDLANIFAILESIGVVASLIFILYRYEITYALLEQIPTRMC